ncbi:MAG: hypothetical protein P4L22_01830 [Candidatus Babeliales bacterium]|nr:hypothetical protein [Candidatus Babeliales bacterium]
MILKIFLILLFFNYIFSEEFLGTIKILTNQHIIRQSKHKKKYFVPKHQINYSLENDPENDLIVPVNIMISNKKLLCYLPLNIFFDNNKLKTPYSWVNLLKLNNDLYKLQTNESIYYLEYMYMPILNTEKNCCIIS